MIQEGGAVSCESKVSPTQALLHRFLVATNVFSGGGMYLPCRLFPQCISHTERAIIVGLSVYKTIDSCRAFGSIRSYHPSSILQQLTRCLTTRSILMTAPPASVDISVGQSSIEDAADLRMPVCRSEHKTVLGGCLDRRTFSRRLSMHCNH